MAIINPKDTIVIDVTQTQVLVQDEFIRHFGVVSNGDTILPVGTHAQVFAADYELIFNTATDDYKNTETYKWLTSFFTNNNRGEAYVVECSAATSAEVVSNLSTFISSGVKRLYNYSLPQSLYNSPEAAALASQYAALNSAQYFSVVTNTIAPSTDPSYAYWTGKRNVMLFYPSPTASENIDGAISGIKAGTFYNLSSTTKMGPLNKKTILGITPLNSLSSTIANDVYNSNIITVQTDSGIIQVIGDLYQDGRQYTYYYGSDYLQYEIKFSLTTLLVNNANSFKPFAFDTTGVKTVKGNINNTIRAAASVGVVESFGESIDGEGNIINTDTVLAVDFATYRSTETEKYNAGIYDGISFVVRIARFIAQVSMKITLD